MLECWLVAQSQVHTQLDFSCIQRPSAQGMVSPTEDWALLHQLTSKHRHAHRPSPLTSIIVYVRVSMYACGWQSVPGVSLCCSPLSSEMGSLTEPWVQWFEYADCRALRPENLAVFTSHNTGITSTPPYPDFIWVLGIYSRCNRLSHIPIPPYHFVRWRRFRRKGWSPIYFSLLLGFVGAVTWCCRRLLPFDLGVLWERSMGTGSFYLPFRPWLFFTISEPFAPGNHF